MLIVRCEILDQGTVRLKDYPQCIKDSYYGNLSEGPRFGTLQHSPACIGQQSPILPRASTTACSRNVARETWASRLTMPPMRRPSNMLTVTLVYKLNSVRP